MKKVLSLLLTLTLVCCMSVTAFADRVTITTTVPERHTVTVEADGGRIIANNRVCGDTVLIERQKAQTYWIVPDKGKELAALYYNGDDVTDRMVGSTFTAPPLINDAALKAVFKDAVSSDKESYTVGGIITDKDGNPIPGATVDIGGHTATTDKDGTFTVPNVPPGTYTVVITDEDGSIIGIGEITIDEPNNADFTLKDDENGNPIITPGIDNTNIDLAIVVNEDGGIDLEDADAYTRDKNLDNPDTVTASVENGSATVTLKDGTKITVTDVTENGLWLTVYLITDPELVTWLEQCLSPYGTNICPMDIYFVDYRGVRTELTDAITVTVETPKDYTDPIVCRVTTNGAVTVTDSSLKGKTITFLTDGNGYCVLAEKLSGTSSTQSGASEITDTKSNSVGSVSGKSPKTGDNGNPWLWGAVMLMICSGLIGLILCGRKKEKNAD